MADPTITITVSFPPEVGEAIRAIAYASNKSKAAVVRAVVERSTAVREQIARTAGAGK